MCIMTPSNLFERDMTHIPFGYVEGVVTHISFGYVTHQIGCVCHDSFKSVWRRHDTHIIRKCKTSLGYVRHDSCNFVWRRHDTHIIFKCKTSSGYVRHDTFKFFWRRTWHTYYLKIQDIIRICASWLLQLCLKESYNSEM